MAKMTKTTQLERMARQGKQLEELSRILETTPGAVSAMMSKLRRKPNFNIKFQETKGRKRGELTQKILDVCYKFLDMHGFYPNSAWVARVLECSREYVRNNRPSSVEENAKFTTLPSIDVPKEFLTFVDNYKEIFDVSRSDAMKSILYNIDWKTVNFREIRLEQQEIQERREM